MAFRLLKTQAPLIHQHQALGTRPMCQMKAMSRCHTLCTCESGRPWAQRPEVNIIMLIMQGTCFVNSSGPLNCRLPVQFHPPALCAVVHMHVCCCVLQLKCQLPILSEGERERSYIFFSHIGLCLGPVSYHTLRQPVTSLAILPIHPTKICLQHGTRMYVCI